MEEHSHQALHHQHEIDGELVAWAKKNEPSFAMKIVVIGIFSLAGTWPYAIAHPGFRGGFTNAAIIPISLIAVGITVASFVENVHLSAVANQSNLVKNL